MDHHVAQEETISATNISTFSDPQFNIEELCPGLSSLQDLSLRGSWRSVLDSVSRSRTLPLLQQPHHILTYITYAVLSYTKLRMYEEAMAELDSLDHHLDSSYYRYESHPHMYPGRSGSMVPFSLRFLYADLPSKTGKRQDTIDRLYSLLNFVRSKLDHAKIDNKNTDSSVSLDLWRFRERSVFDCIICHHFIGKEYDLCLNLIHDFIRRCNNDDVVLWSRLGYVQLQVGDVDGAKESFRYVEGMVDEGKEKGMGDMKLSELRSLVNRNRGLVYLVEKDYVSSVREYEECIDRDGADAVAVNNKALCLMYSRDLLDSIKVLETALERAPTVFLNETLVVNLCSMYELAYVNNSDIKTTLSNWIARVAPDDFDTSCTRI